MTDILESTKKLLNGIAGDIKDRTESSANGLLEAGWLLILCLFLFCSKEQ